VINSYSGVILNVRLWDNFAETIYAYMKSIEKDNEKIILVLQYAKMKTWAGSYVKLIFYL
jgi:hypothetical protein